MAKGKVSEDVVKLIVEAETSKLQQAIHESQKSLKGLENERKSLLEQQAAFKAAHRTESKEYADLTRKIVKNTQAIADEKANCLALTKALGTNAMTMSQLRNEARLLQKQLDNTSESLEPEAYTEYARKLKEINDRMAELKATAKNIVPQDTGSEGILGKFFGSKMSFSALKTVISGNLLTKGLMTVSSFAMDAVSKVKELISEGVEMAKTSDGIRHAFNQLNRPDILDKLREATHGTVNDVELMKAAVQAKDFRLPLDQLGKYLEFAQLKASQTGQSVDYMTNSIITGLGRKSLPILDNLGISAAEVKEEMAKGGDMATAVGRIIERQLAAQGEHYESAAEREQRAITDVQNAQKELGDEMLPLAEKGSNMWLTIQTAALKFFTYLVKAFKQGVAKFVDLYNSSMAVRIGIVALTTSFKVLWSAIRFVVNFSITAFKTMGKQLMNLGEMVEGVFTLNFAKIKNGFTGLFTDAWSGMKSQLKDFKSFGFELGHNMIQGFHEAVDGHITAPSFDGKGGPSGSTSPSGDDSGDGDGSGTTPKKGKATNTDQELLKRLKDSRQKQLDQEKYFSDESVRIYKQQLADKLISQQQFDTLQLSLASTHADKILAVEKEHLESIRQMTFKDARQKQQAIEEQQRNIAKEENDANNARVAAYEDFQKKMEQLESSGMTEAERQKYDHQLQLAALKGYYQAALQYAQEHNEELVSIDLAYQKAKDKLEKDFELQHQQEILGIRQQYGLVKQEELYNQELEQLKRHLDQKELTQEQYEKAVANLHQQYEDRKFQVRQQYGLVKQEELYNQELEQLKRHLDQKELTQEQYEKAVANLHQQYEDRKFQVRQQYGLVSQAELWEQQKEQLLQQHEDGYLTETEYQEALKQTKMKSWKEQFDYYNQLFGDAVKALQDAEMANIDAKYDAEIEAARKAGKDTTAIENKKANDKLKVEKKYADVDFAIKAAQIVADTVVGITRLWASPGYPMAIPLSVLLGAIGTANLVAANAERQKVKSMTLNGSGSSGTSGARVATGREEGGYLDVEREQDGRRFRAKYDPKKRGYVNQPTVIVGEGPRPKEWIASNDAVENPTVAPVIDVLDRMQRTGSIRTFDLQKYLLQKQTRGLARGGRLSPAPSGSSQDTRIPPADKDQTRRLADILERIDRDGLPVFFGLDEFDAQQQRRNQMLNLAKKG